MELEELKNIWQQMSLQIEQQKKLNDKMIMDMTKIKFKNKISTIFQYEAIGSIICFIALITLLWNIQIFDTWPLQICAALSIMILAGIPILSLASVYRMQNINFTTHTYKGTLIEFTRKRSQFLMAQRWGIALSGILLFTILPVSLKIAKGKDFFAGDNPNILWFLPIGLIFLFFITRWGYRCYSAITRNAETILSELDEN